MSQGKSAAHTPGPWKAVLLVDAWTVEGPDGRMLFGVYTDEPQAESDARLIAAARTMLEALESLRFAVIDDARMMTDRQRDAVEKAWKVIKLARGESQ